MPYINGRYHMNPTMGEALEAAREAEAALLAAQQQTARDSRDGSGEAEDAGQGTAAAAPVHRIEIDAAEVVPHATGRATRGFVARVHRATPAPNALGPAGGPETHVFADHRDLVDFLRDALAS